jgi:hypothetical protein
MSEKPPKSKNSSYQNLIEHKCDLQINTKDEQYTCNVSELLRDLYRKIYDLESRLVKLENQTIGAPPDDQHD